MTAKITMNIARDDLGKRIIQWIQFLKPSLAPVTDKEIALIQEVFKLPDKFLAVPFSTIPKRLYCERLSIDSLALQRLILSLFKKGYLIKDEYEEYDVLPLLKNTMIKALKEENKIRFELDWLLPVLESKIIQKEIINETIIQPTDNVKGSNELDIPQEQRIHIAPILEQEETLEEKKQRLAEYRAMRNKHKN